MGNSNFSTSFTVLRQNLLSITSKLLKMRFTLFLGCFLVFLFSCKNEPQKTEAKTPEKTVAPAAKYTLTPFQISDVGLTFANHNWQPGFGIRNLASLEKFRSLWRLWWNRDFPRENQRLLAKWIMELVQPGISFYPLR